MAVVFPLALSACGGDGQVATSDDLTSDQAVERELTIKAYVYVDETATSYAVQNEVQRQVRTAFGPLRIGKISVDDREFHNNIDPATFVKSVLEVVKKGEDGSRSVVKKIARVGYTYKARALVEKSLAAQSAYSLALLMGSYQSFVSEILKSCVENYEHDREFESSFWYVWAPNEATCQALIQKEVTELDKERAGLAENQISERELARRYLPINAELKPTTPPKATYPEYHLLYSLDDSLRDRIVVYEIAGVASHDTDPVDDRFENDLGLKEFFKTLKVLSDGFKTLRVAQGSAVNPLSITFNGKTYPATFQDLYSWIVNQSSFPPGIAAGDSRAFRRAVHDTILLKWLKLEVPLVVSGGRGSKNMTLELRMLFGADSSWNVRSYFKEAFKNGDVVIYNGHSYIGAGPLDPSNYSASDFHGRYQILMFNSCVSFNYYGVSYFNLKSGGTSRLEIVSNGLEVWIQDGGKSVGQLIRALFDGKQSSWLQVLQKTQVSTYWGIHDPNRNVDGEQDNLYDPTTQPITVKEGAGPTPTLQVKNTSAACGGTASGTVQLTATAQNAARVEFYAGLAKLATDTTAPFGVAWDTSKVGNGPVQVRVVASDATGATVEDGCSVTVQNSPTPTGNLLEDTMESGSSNWTATGLWHLAKSSTCAPPGYASAVTAWYFGQDAKCNYQGGGTVKGTLTSRVVTGVSATSRLSFRLFREVESGSSGSYDRTSVEVAVDGSTSWKKIWSKDSKAPSVKSWESSGDLSLAELAGKSVRVRFNFDSVDGQDNAHVGWLIDDVVITP